MDALEFLGLRPTHNPRRWVLPIVPGIATAGRFLFGGCGLAAAICALEQTTSRPVVWATAQYLSYANVGDTMDLDVTLASEGHHTSQARVVAGVVGREILTVNAALGERPLPWSGQWERMPDVASPLDCEVRESRWDVNDSIMERMEFRLASGRQWEDFDGSPSPDGAMALWVRFPGLETSAASLAVLGDYVPAGIAQALGRWTFANSLDNTLRIAQVVPTEWVLCDIRIHAIQHGFGHGLVHLWAEDGTLLATASQSAIVRTGLPPGDDSSRPPSADRSDRAENN